MGALSIAAQGPGPSSTQAAYRDRFIVANGARLYIADWGGNGPVLLFMPGFGNGAHIFDSLAPAFVDRFHVAALTPRGFPPSDAPDSGYTIRQLAADVRVVLDTLQATKAILAGHSISGAVITRFAEDYPDRLLATVYLDAALDFGAAYRRSHSPVRDSLPKPADTTSAPYRDWKRRYPDHDAILDHDAEMWNLDSTEVARRQGLVWHLATEVRTTPHEMSRVKAPALVVCGVGSLERGFGWLTRDSARLQRSMPLIRQLLDTNRAVCDDSYHKFPHARVLMLDAGHYVFLDQRDQVIRSMRAFLFLLLRHASQ